MDVGCQILSLGQYLRPSPRHLEVVEFIHPDQFLKYKNIGESLGLAHVEAGPLVRSSYLADQQAQAAGLKIYAGTNSGGNNIGRAMGKVGKVEASEQVPSVLPQVTGKYSSYAI